MVGLLVGAASIASATAVSVSPSATIPSGTSRAIAVAWSGAAPFSVNFSCGVPGCSSFVGTTSTTSLSRTVIDTVCTTTTRYHNISVTDASSVRVTGSSWTRWTGGPVC